MLDNFFVGNYEEPIEMCLMDEELRSIVREEKSTGWAFVNEGTAEKPKVTRGGQGGRDSEEPGAHTLAIAFFTNF